MNYQNVYNELIRKRREHALQFIKRKTPGIERHHVVPVCLGGTDDTANIVNLTSREHFIAHVLLHKIYPQNIDLLFVIQRFTKGSKRNRTRRNFRVSSRIFEMIRKDVHYFLVNSQWIHSRESQRRRIWKSEPVPDGWSKGMGKASELFMRRMNDRARSKNPILWKGQIYTVREISEETGISQHAIIGRLRLGWDIDKITSTALRRGYDDNDMSLIRRMFEFWKTHTLTETRNKFQSEWKRDSKFTLAKIERIFKKYCPEYETLRKDHALMKIEMYDGKTLAEWSQTSGISESLLRARVRGGMDIHDAVKIMPNKPGWNFTDSPEVKEQKRRQAAEMFDVFVKAGRGAAGLNAVNRQYGTNIGFDAMCRRFKRYGVWKDADVRKYEYNGKFYTIKELAKISGLKEFTIWRRLVKRGYYGKRPMEELLRPILPRESRTGKI